MPIQRPVMVVNTSPQRDLFPGGETTSVEVERPESTGGVIFKRPDPRANFVCGTRLDDYLTAMGQRDGLAIRALLQKQDWQPFEARHQPGGRSPYAPEAMLGLILYGTMKGESSLRGLEDLAQIDIGSLRNTGGLSPDHAALGRFIPWHEALLTGGFVAELTRTVLKETGTGVGTVAGNGTVVQAAASNYHTLKLEAVREAAWEVREKAQGESETPALTAPRRARRSSPSHAGTAYRGASSSGQVGGWSEHPPGRAGGGGTTAEEQKDLCPVLPAERTDQPSPCGRLLGPRPLPGGVAGPEPTRSNRQLGNR